MKTKKHKRIKLEFDRLLSKSLWKQFLVLGIVFFFALGLSYLFLSWSGVEWERFCHEKNLNKWLLPVYLLIDSNALNNLYIGDAGQENAVHGWMLIASSISFLFGAFIFNGIIISMITNSIGLRIRYHRDGQLYYLKSGHYIIMGYDETVISYIKYIFEKDKEAYILILTSADVSAIKEKLRKSLSEKWMNRIIINYGHRISSESYKDIHVETAEHIFIVGNQNRSEHDAINVECIDSIYNYLSEPKITQRPGGITCVFKDLDTYSAFKTTEIFRKITELGIEFTPYNYYTGWAKQVFVKRKYKDFDNPEIEYPAVYGKGITPEDNKYVHLVFVGTTNVAVAFAMEAAHVLHFPNFSTKGVKTRITFIDKNADKEKEEFITRNRHFFEVQSYIYRDLSTEDGSVHYVPASYFSYRNGYKKGVDYDFLDVEFEFIKGDVFSKRVQQEISSWAESKNEYLSIFLAQADQRHNFLMGMNMPDEVYDNMIPIFIRQDRSDNLVTNLRNAARNKELVGRTYYSVNREGKLIGEHRDLRYANIYPFGMNETAFCADDHSLMRAKLINYLYEKANYETHKFVSILALEALSKETIWKEAEKYWQDPKLTVAKKWSNIYSAYTMRIKLATLRAMRGLDINNTSCDFQALSDEEVRQIARVEHNRWNVEELLMGYRKARKNEDKYNHKEYSSKLKNNKDFFIHHDIRPFDELDSIKELDYEFSRYIPWIMKMTEN